MRNCGKSISVINLLDKEITTNFDVKICPLNESVFRENVESYLNDGKKLVRLFNIPKSELIDFFDRYIPTDSFGNLFTRKYKKLFKYNWVILKPYWGSRGIGIILVHKDIYKFFFSNDFSNIINKSSSILTFFKFLGYKYPYKFKIYGVSDIEDITFLKDELRSYRYLVQTYIPKGYIKNELRLYVSFDGDFFKKVVIRKKNYLTSRVPRYLPSLNEIETLERSILGQDFEILERFILGVKRDINSETNKKIYSNNSTFEKYIKLLKLVSERNYKITLSNVNSSSNTSNGNVERIVDIEEFLNNNFDNTKGRYILFQIYEIIEDLFFHLKLRGVNYPVSSLDIIIDKDNKVYPIDFGIGFGINHLLDCCIDEFKEFVNDKFKKFLKLKS